MLEDGEFRTFLGSCLVPACTGINLGRLGSLLGFGLENSNHLVIGQFHCRVPGHLGIGQGGQCHAQRGLTDVIPGLHRFGEVCLEGVLELSHGTIVPESARRTVLLRPLSVWSMWHALFHLDLSVAEKIIRPVLVYGFLLIALRVGGKRELGQLNTMDFIVLLAVANAVQNGIIGDDNSVTGAVIGATTLFVINGIAAIATLRSRRVRRLLIGTPRVLISNGVVDDKALKREKLTLDDLREPLSNVGAGSVADVELMTLEPNGHFATTLLPRDAVSDEVAALRLEIQRLADIISSR